MCPIYQYLHPETNEVFEELRTVKNRNKPFYAPDGTNCKKVISKNIDGYKGKREVFEVDPDYVKKCRPKKVRFNDGHEEVYDPTRHF